MPKHQRTSSAEPQAEQPRTNPVASQEQNGNDIGSKIATVAAVGVAAALIEVELVPGILLGAAAVFAPSVFPRLSNGMRPLLKSAISAGYTMAGKARETFAEASEQFQDVVAEVKAEHHGAAGSAEYGSAEYKDASEAAASGEIA